MRRRACARPKVSSPSLPPPPPPGAAIAARLLGSAAWAGSPHAVVYVHCAKLREVDTTPLLDAAMTGGKRCAPLQLPAPLPL